MDESALQLWRGVLFRQRPDLSFESISAHVQEWTGLEPHRALDAVHPSDRAKPGQDRSIFRLRHARTGRITWIEQRRRSLDAGYEGYWENVSERMQLSQELAQAQWKGTLGLATQRLVHDFNNLLTGILSLSDAYLMRVKADNPAREGLQQINHNAKQAADIVKEIGGMFREAPSKRLYDNLSAVVGSAGDMLRRLLPKHSVVKVDVKSESIPVYLDALELKRVIVSLGFTLTPPVQLEVGLGKKQAWLTIRGAVANPPCRALLVAETFADRNEARFAVKGNQYELHFPEANFSEVEQGQRSILLVAEDGSHAFRVADLLRRNSYQVVIGPANLMHSPDYRFDVIAELLEGSNSRMQNADIVFRRGMGDGEMLMTLSDWFAQKRG